MHKPLLKKRSLTAVNDKKKVIDWMYYTLDLNTLTLTLQLTAHCPIYTLFLQRAGNAVVLYFFILPRQSGRCPLPNINPWQTNWARPRARSTYCVTLKIVATHKLMLSLRHSREFAKINQPPVNWTLPSLKQIAFQNFYVLQVWFLCDGFSL